MKRYLSFCFALVVMVGIAMVQYSPVSAASPHVPGIIFHQDLIGQNADIPSVFSVVAPATGADYRVSIYANTVGGGNSGDVAVDFNDGFTLPALSECASGITSASNEKTCVVHAAPNSTVNIAVMNSQNVGSEIYNAYITMEEL